jgi:hypothetical protein
MYLLNVFIRCADSQINGFSESAAGSRQLESGGDKDFLLIARVFA